MKIDLTVTKSAKILGFSFGVAIVVMLAMSTLIGTHSVPVAPLATTAIAPMPVIGPLTNFQKPHSAAWQKGYEVGRLHRVNGEKLPSFGQLYSMEEMEGAGFEEGYITGFQGQ